jgi:cytosine/adenosine deaminase-related metal-dependent hydrolase
VIVFTAGWVCPGDGPPIRDGRVAVRDGRVAWLGAAGDPGQPAGTPRHLGCGVLLPGPVNAHCHVELSHLAGRVDGSRGFTPWVEELVARRAATDPAEARRAAAAAIDGLVARGTAAIGDVSNTLKHLGLLAASGLRSVVFHELLAWDPAAAERALASADAAAPAADAGGVVEVRVAAHAPHSVSPRLFAGLRARGGPCALHLAESRDEVEFLARGDGAWGAFLARRGLGHVRFDPPGQTPVAYADALGALHPRLVAAHGVQVDADDARTLARRGVALALCPRSNAALGNGVPPLPLLLEAGVRLSLGSDSLASTPTLDVLDDAAALHRAFPEVPADVLVRMATAGGADALGLDGLGAIRPGALAALAYAEAEGALHDPLGFLVSGEARTRRVDAV